MKTIIIDPNKKTIEMITTKTFDQALERAGLPSGEVDWQGMGRTADGRSITLMAYEFGLRPDISKKGEPKYLRIGRMMYAGNLLIFAADEMGENTDMTEEDMQTLRKGVEWLEDRAACEEAFACGKMDRPNIAINGQIVWQWNVN